MKSGIYWIVSPSGKAYIGSSQNILKRIWTHRRDLMRGAHANEPLQRAADKYGIDALHFAVIEYCPIELLIEREQFHIDTQGFDSLYNTAPIAGATRGVKISEAKRAKMRVAAKTRMQDPELRSRIAAGMRARLADPAERAKIAEAQRKRYADPAERAKVSERNRERYADPAERAKVSESNRKRYADPVARAKTAAASKLCMQNLGTREKIAEVMRNRVVSDETRARLAEAARKRYADPGERAKTAVASKLRMQDPELRAKIAEVMRNRVVSDETRAKLAMCKAAAANPISGYQGVYPEGNKWFARVRAQDGRRRIGRFASPELAYTWRLAYIAQMEWGHG